MAPIWMTFSCYFFVFITKLIGSKSFFNKQNYVLQVPLPTRNVYNIILQPIIFLQISSIFVINRTTCLNEQPSYLLNHMSILGDFKFVF